MKIGLLFAVNCAFDPFNVRQRLEKQFRSGQIIYLKLIYFNNKIVFNIRY